ncbi:hypothetical protein M422DRAFT_240589 [Sphaerobolus stellatus SS14]|nr:hypothetical protein M422DRAFT_240589 [Sphaerobolus stellatus SS14]
MQPHSPSSVSLPTSPPDSQSNFEALIELLATDSDELFQQTNSNEQPEPPDLRDEDGRLDFGKIKTMFSSKALNSTDNGEPSPRPDSNFNLVVDTSLISEGPLSGSMQIASPTASGLGGFHGFHSTPLNVQAESTPLEQPLLGNNNDLIDLTSDDQYHVYSRDQPISFATDAIAPNTPQTQSSLSSVRTALNSAHKDIEVLRQRCQELESLIQESRGDTSSKPVTSASHPNLLPPRQQSQDTHEGTEDNPAHDDAASSGLALHKDHDVDIDSLSLSQARYALKELLDELAIPTSAVKSLLQDKRAKTRETIPVLSLDGIHRAKELAVFTDELVWRRSRMGAEFENPFCEENIQSLKDRLELWERAVRTRK